MKKLLIIILAAGVCGIGVVFALKNIKINSLECTSQFGPCSETMEGKIQSVSGKSVWEINSFLANELTQENRVEKYSTRFVLPPKLIVSLVEDKPYIAVSKQGVGKFLLYGKSGNLMREEDRTNLLVLVLEERDLPQDYLTSDLKFSAELLHGLFSLYEIKIASVYPTYLKAEIKPGVVAIFPLEGDPGYLLGSLNLIFSRLNSDTQVSRIEIDLRYKNPVIR